MRAAEIISQNDRTSINSRVSQRPRKASLSVDPQKALAPAGDDDAGKKKIVDWSASHWIADHNELNELIAEALCRQPHHQPPPCGHAGRGSLIAQRKLSLAVCLRRPCASKDDRMHLAFLRQLGSLAEAEAVPLIASILSYPSFLQSMAQVPPALPSVPPSHG